MVEETKEVMDVVIIVMMPVQAAAIKLGTATPGRVTITRIEVITSGMVTRMKPLPMVSRTSHKKEIRTAARYGRRIVIVRNARSHRLTIGSNAPPITIERFKTELASTAENKYPSGANLSNNDRAIVKFVNFLLRGNRPVTARCNQPAGATIGSKFRDAPVTKVRSGKTVKRVIAKETGVTKTIGRAATIAAMIPGYASMMIMATVMTQAITIPAIPDVVEVTTAEPAKKVI